MRGSPETSPTLQWERELQHQGYHLIAGVDEVGRGSWAGPVVAAAVILPLDVPTLEVRLGGVRDSKQLSSARRQELYTEIRRYSAAVAVGWATHHVIDRLGIVAANQRAMCRAINALKVAPDALLLDAFPLPASPLPQIAIVKGDAQSLSIAAASIVAKVVRDHWMTTCDARFPAYGFARHKGYGTERHGEALRTHGPCRLHRRSFAPVAELTE